MLEQIRRKAARFEEIEKLIQDPKVINQPAQYSALMKERGQLLKVVAPYQEVQSLEKQLREAESLLADP